MSLNSPSPSPEYSAPVQETLTKAQKAVLDRVIAILDADPKLKEDLNKKFERNFQDIVSDAEKFNLLLEKIGQTEMQKLGEIEKRFNANEVTEDQAKAESKHIITHYTQMKLSALDKNVQSNEV